MHTATRSAEKCWLILLWSAWRLSFEGIQYARSIEGIKHARVLVSYISTRLVRMFSSRCIPFFFLRDVFHFFFPYKLKNSFATLLVLFSRWQQQSNCRRKLWSQLIRISRYSLHTDSNNHTEPVASMRVASKPLPCNCRIVSLRWYHTRYLYIHFSCGANTSTSIRTW